jgi:hypothetical protein
VAFIVGCCLAPLVCWLAAARTVRMGWIVGCLLAVAIALQVALSARWLLDDVRFILLIPLTYAIPVGLVAAVVVEGGKPGVPGGGAFIESFIAPDMHMRPLSATVGMLQNPGWEVRGVQAMREHYVRTVREWLATLEERWARAVELVGVETARGWRLYLAGAALAFGQGRMGVDQILAA